MSEDSEEALPTAAWRKIDGNYYNLVVESDKEKHVHNLKDVAGDYREWDELVQRKDVEALIQDKIEEHKNYDLLSNSSVEEKAKKQALKELLDEVQSE